MGLFQLLGIVCAIVGVVWLIEGSILLGLILIVVGLFLYGSSGTLRL